MTKKSQPQPQSRASKESAKYKPLDPMVKTFWVNSLRSKQYKQCYGNLKNSNKEGDQFCCLGVLAVISGAEEFDDGYGGIDFKFQSGFKSDASLPEGYMGITKTVQKKLIKMNDDMNYSFDEIADWIDINL